MKKLLLILIILVFVLTVNAQYSSMSDSNISMGLGISATTLDVGNASPVGLVMDIDIMNVHFDFASNLASGQGEYLDFSSSQTRKANKQLWYSINAGYAFNFKQNWSIIPKIGIVLLRNIYEDPIAWDTYYDEAAGTKFQAGGEIRYRINLMYIKVGSATTEIFSCGAGFIF